MPVVAPMVATEVLLLLHVPPDVAIDSAEVAPAQTLEAPVISAGSVSTVTTIVLKQPDVIL